MEIGLLLPRTPPDDFRWQVIHVESTGVPIQYRGQIQHFGMFRDITARKQVEEKLRETEKKYRS